MQSKTKIEIPLQTKTLNPHCICYSYTYMFILRPSSAISGYIPNVNECLCPPKDMNENVHSSFIHNDQKLETTQMSISIRMDNYIMLYSYNRILLYGMEYYNKEKEKLLLLARTWMNITNTVLIKISQPQKVTSVWFYLYKVHKQAKPTHGYFWWGSDNDWERAQANLLGYQKWSIPWSVWWLSRCIHM